MKNLGAKTIKTIMLPVIVYCVFLCICFERFSNWNCVYTIFLQTIIPTITAYAVAYGNICGIFDFTIGARVIISGVVGGLLAADYGMPGMILGALAASLVTASITGFFNRVLYRSIRNIRCWVLHLISLSCFLFRQHCFILSVTIHSSVSICGQWEATKRLQKITG